MPKTKSFQIFTVLLILTLMPAIQAHADWYWKADQPNAPSGMPDFDQNQDAWCNYCAPTAAANCLWWFGLGPGQGYPTPPNLIVDLADRFKTDCTNGTYVDDMKNGLNGYFRQFGLGYRATLFTKPDFGEMADLLEKSQDIILCVYFWYTDGFEWHIAGGHAVTMAGVDQAMSQVAISDPDDDNAVQDSLLGRVRPPTHPSDGAYDAALHNDPTNVSHDQFDAVMPPAGFPSWEGTWELDNYFTADKSMDISGLAIPREYLKYYVPGAAPANAEYHSVVGHVVMVCPSAPPIPSLTGWGIALLILLMIISLIFVLRKKRAVLQ